MRKRRKKISRQSRISRKTTIDIMRHSDKIQESAKGITVLNCKESTMPTATQSKELPKGHTLTQETYFVFYGEHDNGAKPGVLIRETLERAEWSANLMGQCG